MTKRAHKVEQDRHQNNFNPTFYDPKMIFSREDRTAVGNKIPLAEAFVKNRYEYNPDTQQVTPLQKSFSGNAGAVQLFDVNGSKARSKIFPTLSIPIQDDLKQKTSLGHSEKLGMREALDSYMPQNFSEGSIRRPSEYGRLKNPDARMKEILEKLVENADKYNTYLENKGIAPYMWSELAPCQSGQGNCTEFMQKISPPGSQYGFTIPKGTYDAKALQEAREAVGSPYETYKKQYEQPGALPQGIGLTNLISPLPTTSPLGTSSHHPYGTPSPYFTSSSLPSSGGRGFSGYGNPFNPTPSGLGLSSSQQFSGGRGIGGYPELPGSMMMSGNIVAPPPKRINTGERRSSGFSTTSPTSSPLLSPIQSGRFFSPSPQGGMGGQPIAHYLPQRPVTPPPSNPNPPPQTSYTTPSDEAFWENYNPADWPD